MAHSLPMRVRRWPVVLEILHRQLGLFLWLVVKVTLPRQWARVCRVSRAVLSVPLALLPERKLRVEVKLPKARRPFINRHRGGRDRVDK